MRGGDFGQGSGGARGGLSAGEEGQARSGLDGMVGGREAREEAGLSIQPGELEACTGQGRWGRIRVNTNVCDLGSRRKMCLQTPGSVRKQ